MSFNPLILPDDPGAVGDLERELAPTLLEELEMERKARKARAKRPLAENVGDAYPHVMTWRHHVGRGGPKDSMTRAILLTISTFMYLGSEPKDGRKPGEARVSDEKQQPGEARVSDEKIAEYAQVTVRCVQKHVDRAVREGWLIREIRRGHVNRFMPAIPESFTGPGEVRLSSIR